MRTSQHLPLLLAAGICLLLAPLVAWAAVSYGVESIVWDGARGTYAYLERPASGLVLALGSLSAIGLTLAAVVLTIASLRHRRASSLVVD